MKKQKNINMKIGATMFRKVEQMDLSGLTTVRMAILKEGQRIQASLQGNCNAQTAGLLHTQAAILRKQMQRVDQIGRSVISSAIPEIPKHLMQPAEVNAHAGSEAVSGA